MGDFSDWMGLEPIGDYLERKLNSYNYTKITSKGTTVHKAAHDPGIPGIIEPMTITSDTFYPNKNKVTMEQTKVIQRTQEDLEGFTPSDGKGRMYDHKITVDGVEHHFYSNKRELTDFVAGAEATFTVEQKAGKQGVRHVIKPVKKAPVFTKNPGFAGRGGNSPYSKDDSVITYLSVLSSVFTGMQQSSEVFNKEKVAETVEYFYQKAAEKRGKFN